MATHIKNIPFIGGDIATFEFDFGTKVAKSRAECPLTSYASCAPALVVPSNKGSDWTTQLVEEPTQQEIDKMKTLDGNAIFYTQSTNGAVTQIIVEVDLNPLCNSLFGNSNSSLKAAIKGVDVDCYAKGSGIAALWAWYNVDPNLKSSQNGWQGLDPYNSSTNMTDSIMKIPYSTFRVAGEWQTGSTPYTPRVLIDSTNHMYFAISTFASNGTSASSIGLDYINIKLSFSRVKDVTNPIPLTLTDTWSMLIKGYAPAWDNTANGKMGFQVYSSDASASYEIQFNNGCFDFVKWIGNSGYHCTSSTMNFNKFTTFNILVEQTSIGKRMRILPNNKTINKHVDTDVNKINNNCYLSFNNHFNTSCADAFYNGIIFMPNRVFDNDVEAEAVLRGTTSGFEEDELFDINKLTLYSGASVSNGILTQVVSEGYKSSYVSIPVLPNNQYTISVEVIGAGGYINWGEYYNSILTYGEDFHSGVFSKTFTTGPKTNTITIYCSSVSAGTFIYKNISLKLKM